jgi:hypothetical protein
MLGYSDTPSTPLLLDLSSYTSDLPFVRLPTKPLPKFGTFFILMSISNVVTVSSQISSCVACQS